MIRYKEKLNLFSYLLRNRMKIVIICFKMLTKTFHFYKKKQNIILKIATTDLISVIPNHFLLPLFLKITILMFN